MTWTARLLAGACIYGAWTYIGDAIRLQSPDEYWFGVAFAAQAWGLIRRLNWARTFGLLGLAFWVAWKLWEESAASGVTVGGALTAMGGMLAAWILAKHPQHFSRGGRK